MKKTGAKVRNFEVCWRKHVNNANREGVSENTHEIYMKEMGLYVKETMIEEVRKCIKSMPENDDLINEINSHLLFCKYRAKTFYGRENLTEKGMDSLLTLTQRQPLIIHGFSGSGKSHL